MPMAAPSPTAAGELLALINAGWTTPVIRAACVHRLPDHIAGGAVDAEALSAATACDADALTRLLRAMAALGLCKHEAAAHDGRMTPRPPPASTVRWWI